MTNKKQIIEDDSQEKIGADTPQTSTLSQAFLSKIKKLKPLHVGLIILLAAIAILAVFYLQTQIQLKSLKSDPQEVIKTQTKNTVDKVGKLVALPQGEDPTVATVSDPSKLKSQPIFSETQKDDRVLIYAKAKKIIIYRPNINKVISFISDVNIGSSQTGQVAGAQTNQKLRFAIFNGTNTTGLARKYQKEVETKVQNSQVATVGDAKSKDVAKTFIVSISGQDASGISQTLGIDKGNLPDGEQKPDADFLIILGQDKVSL